ncbi:Alpha/Beta hydrolase protein [Xylaria bambusicola]|uniref:Alpha/Beta hydrolase protein n=1 Tax=Xylaria bambusicola TaxID=326684 RepID=UPI002008A7C6|nr:Alpha/Beta hydrolase protein [Xylaria bambusicola]KAI0506603.1 Alpha/Beta hydrolase protein [Xylaria bambusicola]
MKIGGVLQRLSCLVVAVAWAAAGGSAELVLSASGPIVSLGYATYEGYYNGTYDLNIWKSIRYAAPPTGNRRWQAPEPPLHESSAVIPAVAQPPLCPQTGAFGVPKAYGFNSGLGNEDCLYLNVYAAPNATNLPVLVWIHGGGHSVFGAQYDPSVWMNTNDNGFIVVEMQYRLGAFGFLASPDVKKSGRLNTGLLDQRFAIEWTRKYIAKFGGDPNRITIGGESSGAASVVFHSLAYGGKETGLFNNMIVASPYLPTVYKYSDSFPKARYDKFVELAGCNKPAGNKTTFDCLVAADTTVLQYASGNVSTKVGYFGSFGFLPVIDDDYIRERPAVQLASAKFSGKRVLVGNNGNEGSPLFNPNISTRAQYDDFITETFPLFTSEDINKLNKIYEISDELPPDDGVVFDTLGYTGPTALTQSGIATGIQQSAFNLAAETVFDCPAQWVAEAFSTGCTSAWRYQYSVTPSYHGADLRAYFAVGASTPAADFRHAMQKIWGNFIINNTPVIPVADAMGNYENASVPVVGNKSVIDWPRFTRSNPVHMNLNTTGGDVKLVTVGDTLAYYVRSGPGVVNTFSLADSFAWEGSRGDRCNFWRAVSARVPQ